MCEMSCSDGLVAEYQHPVGKAKAKTGTESDGLYDAQLLNALYISVVSSAEIRFAVELQPDLTRRAELNDWPTFRQAFAGRVLPVTEAILRRWRTLMEEGRKIGHAD